MVTYTVKKGLAKHTLTFETDNYEYLQMVEDVIRTCVENEDSIKEDENINE